MGLGKFVKKTINVVGTAAKVGVELGADAVGAIAEKIDDNPESKEKYQNMGKKLGANIKSGASKIADSSVDVVDNAVESGSKICRNIGDEISEKISSVKTKGTDAKKGTVVKSVDFEEVKEDGNYGVIKINNNDNIDN